MLSHICHVVTHQGMIASFDIEFQQTQTWEPLALRIDPAHSSMGPYGLHVMVLGWTHGSYKVTIVSQVGWVITYLKGRKFHLLI